MKRDFHPFYNLQHDLPAGLVVFLVALPLCLGIALASGAPLLSGIIAGVIGGIAIGFFSNSALSVSGPAAGLTVIVLNSVEKLGSFESFLLAVLLAGIFQFILGIIKAGTLGNYFPNSVIKGMLAAIGLILIMKQIPHAIGYDPYFEGDESFIQSDGENTFSELFLALGHINWVITGLTIISILILILFETATFKKYKWTTFLPAPLLVVILGVLVQTQLAGTNMELSKIHLVNIPNIDSLSTFKESMSFPDFSQILQGDIWIVAITICIVASLESLLSIDAIEKIDPYKRISDLNRELKAQGIGNFLSGLFGGLPVTSVIVRSTANATSGARTKASAIFHGFLLFFCTLLLPWLLNKIPISSLAAILLLVGYKLVKPELFISIYKKGLSQFIPFLVTCLAIFFTDLLTGIAIGMATGIFYVLKTNFHEAFMLVSEGDRYLIKLTKDVSFINKKALRDKLLEIPDGSYVIIDGTSSQFIDYDILDTISDFSENAQIRDITVDIKNVKTAINKSLNKEQISA